ncbi:MAG: sulfate permease [Actinomycetota bacterium]
MAAWLRDYQWNRWLRIDVIAGISVAALLIPESLGYAKIAGLPPEVGLYAAPLALLGYVIFGRSTVLVLATSSSTAAVSASIIAGMVSGKGTDPVMLSAALALFTGVIFVVAGLLRLGWVANFMSKTVIEGFIVGLSISIIIGQFDDLLGIEIEGENAIEKLLSVFGNIGNADLSAMVVGIGSLLLLIGLERFIPKLPAALTVVILSVFYVQIFDPATLAIVGDIPQGLPSIGVPTLSASEISGLFAGGLAVALIGFSEGYGGAVTYARKYGDRLESNQEFIAYGASNIGASLTSGMVVGGSLSKSAANDAAGAKSQISNVVSAVLVILTLLFLAPFFESLPEATLAAVVIHALLHSADPRKLAPVWRFARLEFWIAAGVLAAVLVLDTLPAIVLGVVISIGIVIFRVSFPQSSELGRDPETGRLESLNIHRGAEAVPGIVVYRFEAPLFYANAEAFATRAHDLIDAAEPEARVLVIDCEMMFAVDYTGVEALDGLIEDLEMKDVEIRLARVHNDMLERIRTSGTLEAIGDEQIFDRIGDAVAKGI